MKKINQINISVRMKKKRGILFGIALLFLFSEMVLATSSANVLSLERKCS